MSRSRGRRVRGSLSRVVVELGLRGVVELGLVQLRELDLRNRVDLAGLTHGAVLAEPFELDRASGRVDDLGLLDDERERLAAGDVGHQHRQVAALDVLLGELVRVEPGLGGALDDVGGQLLLRHLQFLGPDQLVEDELRSEVSPQVLLELGAVAVVTVSVGEVLLDLCGDDAFRQGNLAGVGEQSVEHLVPSIDRLLEALDPLRSLPQVGAQLVQGVELAGHLCELVVELGKLLLLDRTDGDLAVDLVPGVGTEQSGAECCRLPGGESGDGVVDALDKLTTADLVRDAGGLPALDRLAVLRGLQVDHDEVTLGGGTVDTDHGPESRPKLCHLLVDVGLGDLDVVDLDVQALPVGQRHGWAYVDLDGELELLSVGELGDVDLGLAKRLELVVLDRLAVELRHRLVDCLVEDSGAADALVDHQRRNLALAEAGNAHLDREPDPGRVEGLDDALHWGSSPGLRDRRARFAGHRGLPTGVGTTSSSYRPGWGRSDAVPRSGYPDLNRGPSAPKADALPSCAIPRKLPAPGLGTRGRLYTSSLLCRRNPGTAHSHTTDVRRYRAMDRLTLLCTAAYESEAGLRGLTG